MSLHDYARTANIPSDLLDSVAREVSWLRETTLRVTPRPDGITRELTDGSAFAYYGSVSATIYVLRQMGLLGEAKEEKAAEPIQSFLETEKKSDMCEDYI